MLNEDRSERLKLIYDLKQKGMSTKDISNYLNLNGYMTPKGKEYYPKLVWVTLKKYQKRLDRLKDYKVVRKEEKYTIVGV